MSSKCKRMTLSIFRNRNTLFASRRSSTTECSCLACKNDTVAKPKMTLCAAGHWITPTNKRNWLFSDRLHVSLPCARLDFSTAISSTLRTLFSSLTSMAVSLNDCTTCPKQYANSMRNFNCLVVDVVIATQVIYNIFNMWRLPSWPKTHMPPVCRLHPVSRQRAIFT